MPEPSFLDPRLTEHRNPRTVDIDVASSEEVVDMLHAEDRLVPDAVHAVRASLARTIDLTVDAFHNGGRLIYVGAGTSGRLGVLDASECPPTFGSPPGRVVGILAGGPEALVGSREGAEDDTAAAVTAIDQHEVGANDMVVGIAASGATPFVGAALARARERGSRVALVACTEPAPEVAALCDETIVARVGPEALAGSTRLKAGTATKMILNAISTGAMIRSGKAYGNLMVDLAATSTKLVDRGERIVMEAGGIDRAAARRVITSAGGEVKTAIVMVRAGVDAPEARRRLEEAGGRVRDVAGDPPPVTS